MDPLPEVAARLETRRKAAIQHGVIQPLLCSSPATNRERIMTASCTVYLYAIQ